MRDNSSPPDVARLIMRASRAQFTLMMTRLVERGFIFWDFLNQAAVAKYGHIAANKTHFEAKEICAMATRAGFGASTILGEPDRRVRMLYAER